MQVVTYARKSPGVAAPDPSKTHFQRGIDQRLYYKASCETQLQQCREWCDKQGHQIVASTMDPGFSGADKSRPGLWDAVHSVPRRGALVCYKFDRVARLATLFGVVQWELAKKGAVILSVTEATHEQTAEDRLVASLLSQIAEYNREISAARTSAMMRMHQKNGRRMGGLPPYGWIIDPHSPPNVHGLPGRWMVNPAEQEAIELIKEMASFELTPSQIARRLNKAGNQDCRGARWNNITISAILRREGF